MHWQCCHLSDFSPQDYDRAYRELSSSRKAHIDRFRLPEDARRSLAAELLVQQLLERCGFPQARLQRRETGAPYLQDSALQVSICHCQDLVACAVSDLPVGIDTEKLRPIDLAIAQRICTDRELSYLLQDQPLPARGQLCRDPALLYRFFEIWTAKEAYFKKCGTGITNLRAVDILSLERQCFTVEDYLIQIVKG